MWSVKFEVWSAKSAVCSVRCGVSREGHGRDRVSLNYRSFMFGKLPPPACPGLCYIYMYCIYIHLYMDRHMLHYAIGYLSIIFLWRIHILTNITIFITPSLHLGVIYYVYGPNEHESYWGVMHVCCHLYNGRLRPSYHSY